jgi:glycosyltransferase involved in cell wall biosynthesis
MQQAANPAALRLLWLTERYYPEQGGMAQSCDRIVTTLREAGVVIDLVHLTGKRAQWRMESGRNGRYITAPPGNDPAHALNRLWSMLEAAHAQTPWTHVVAFGGQVALLAAPVYAAWLGVPLITLLRGNDFDTGIFSLRQRPLLQAALERSAAVCVVSRDKARRITALYPQIQPHWIPNGIDLDTWALLPSERQRAADWRAEHVAPERRVLGMFGHIKPKKAGLFFLQTLLNSGYAERFHLLIVGAVSPEIEGWLEMHAGELHMSRSDFVEHSAMLWRYAACDLVVVPSFYDGMPNVLLEATALGVPLLAARVGGMADLLADREHGFLFAPGDAHDCRWAITQAATATDAELQQYGAAGRTLVASSLTHRQEAQRYLEMLYDTLPETQ